MFNFVLGFVFGAAVAHIVPPMVMLEWAKIGWTKVKEIYANLTKAK